MIMERPVSFLLIIVFWGATLFLKAQGEVLFFEEHIDFSLDSNYFSINGIYSFQNKNNRNITQHIAFPFAEKSTKIDSIRIIDLYSGREIDFNRKDNFIFFFVYLPVNDTVDVNIFYRQKTAVNNKYIITSTQSWGKPLKTAIYTLTTGKNVKIKSFTYLPDSVNELDNKTVYLWEKHDFIPENDFEIILEE